MDILTVYVLPHIISLEILKLKVGYSLKADAIIEVLADLFLKEGLPEYIRSDNGSEFVAKIVQEFLEKTRVKTAYITPSSPWKNGFNERFNGILSDELLNGKMFYKILTMNLDPKLGA